MPRYFFDIDDTGQQMLHDDEGSELPGADQARLEALAVLPDLARDELPDGDRRAFTVVVRDDNGRSIFRATLSLHAEWMNAAG